MAEYIEIIGGKPLTGKVRIGGAKNASLPMIIASLLSDKEVRLTNIPNIHDVSICLHLIETLGAEVSMDGSTVLIKTPKLKSTKTSYSLVKSLRASFWVLAPLLARGKSAKVALPGGDIIGARPVDLHIESLKKMGAKIKVSNGAVTATAPEGLKPADIDLRFPSVGATHQVLMAAALTEGTTTLKGAAREPEVVALSDMLSSMGAKIEGAGSDTIKITGQKKLLNGCDQRIIGDRLEAATYLLSGISSRGKVTVTGIKSNFLKLPLEILKDKMGVKVSVTSNSITVDATAGYTGTDISTGPYPDFATDLQALFMAVLATAKGKSSIEENIFEGRFGNVSELCRMGAKIKVDKTKATIEGVKYLTGARVDGLDIRAAAALVIAACGAKGATYIHEISHLRRGYEDLETKLKELGVQVSLRHIDLEDFLYAGC